jgi:hypothetical protein
MLNRQNEQADSNDVISRDCRSLICIVLGDVTLAYGMGGDDLFQFINGGQCDGFQNIHSA